MKSFKIKTWAALVAGVFAVLGLIGAVWALKEMPDAGAKALILAVPLFLVAAVCGMLAYASLTGRFMVDVPGQRIIVKGTSTKIIDLSDPATVNFEYQPPVAPNPMSDMDRPGNFQFKNWRIVINRPGTEPALINSKVTTDFAGLVAELGKIAANRPGLAANQVAEHILRDPNALNDVQVQNAAAPMAPNQAS